MDWSNTPIRTVALGPVRKMTNTFTSEVRYSIVYTKYLVPAAYEQLIAQLTAEQTHAVKHNSHESCRRQMYARRVLDAFAKELLANDAQPFEDRIPPECFRSKVLTPIVTNSSFTK